MQLTASLMHTLLVACDQSYKTTANGVVAGDVLTYYPDSNGGNPGTDHMPSGWFADLDGWTVAKRIDDPDTGFGATVYQKAVAGQPGKFDYIVALQGTRGPSMQDWNDNITYGWKKFYSDKGGKALIDYLTGVGEDGILNTTNQINFTGQSLGGALAQYTAYRYVDKLTNVDLSKISLTTFNGLGGVQGLMDNYAKPPSEGGFGAEFQAGLLAGVATAHYYVENDFVSRLGTGNLNGAGNEYCLNFQTQKDGTLVQYDPVDAHRIENGFYRGFNLGLTNPSLGPSDFTFMAKNIAHLVTVTGVAGVAGTITTLLDDNYSGGQESFTRLLAGLIVGCSFGDADARKEVVLGILDHLKAAGKIGDGWFAWAANVGDKAPWGSESLTFPN